MKLDVKADQVLWHSHTVMVILSEAEKSQHSLLILAIDELKVKVWNKQ
jgi:hypothetical protein